MRVVVVVCLLVAVGGGCRSEPVRPSVRARLAPPLVELAGMLEQAEGMADSARYRAERGEPMREAIALVRGVIDDVRASAAELAHAAVGLTEPQAQAIARQSVQLALEAADATDAELDALMALVEVDVAMDQVVAAWRGGDQPAAGAALTVVDAEMAELAATSASPAPCGLLRENRVRWHELLTERTTQVTETEGEGLREAFLASPFGEDRRLADAGDRSCWREHGALPGARAQLRPLVERFDELTRPDS